MVVVTSPEELEQLIRRAVREELAAGRLGATSVLTTTQAAEAAGVSAKTVREWISTGVLPAGRRGRKRTIQRADLERYLSGSRSQQAKPEDLERSLTSRSA